MAASCSSHAHADPVPSSRRGARAGCSPERNAAQDECEGGHQDRTQPQFRALQSGLGKGLAFLVFSLGKFHDQNRVLGGKTDQHDQYDLRIDIVLHATEVQRDKCAEDGRGRAEQNAER